MLRKYIQQLVLCFVPVLLLACAPGSGLRTQDRATVELQDFELLEATITDVHRAIRNKQMTCLELVRNYQERIEKYDTSSKLNAITNINPRAVEEAIKLDNDYKRTRRMRRMHCVPLIVKENFLTAGIPTTAGSQVLRNFIPQTDAFMVAALKREGAIVLAKSNMAEWAFSPYVTISSVSGETRNPYDLNRTPAGSSGGTAAAVAANFALVGLGTDTGNSIRGPAAHTALVGIRSTLGSTSRSGVIPLLMNRDIAGPLTRTVEDAARVFAVVAGYDPDDPVTEKGKGKLPADYMRYLRSNGLKGFRIGVLRALIRKGDEDFEVVELMEQAIADLKQAGAEIIDPFEIPNFDELRNLNGFCSRFRYDLNRFLKQTPNVPIQSLEQIVDSRAYLQSNQKAIDWAMSVNVSPQQQKPPCVDVDSDPRRKSFRDSVRWAMDKHKVDAIVYPTWTNPPRRLGDLESAHGNNSPVIAPHTGQPAITVPMGFTQAQLPVGLQFLGRQYSEALLFQFAYAYEQATQHRFAPPLFP